MNKNVVIVLVGGFVIAILVAVLVQASLGGKKQDVTDNNYVLVAAKNLPLGSNLGEGDLRWQSWPGNPFSGAIVREGEQKATDALAGRLTQRVEQGQPVMTSYIVREGRGNIVAATLEKGMRAVAIPVKANTMVGGFISPGDYVDVIMTYRVRVSGNTDTMQLVNRNASETILKNVKVIAVDQDAKSEGDSAKLAKTVTLAVDTKGAEKLALGAEMGDLILSLRGLGDAETEDTSDYTTDVLTSKVLQDVSDIRGGSTGRVKVYSGAQMVEQRPGSGSVVTDGYTDEQMTQMEDADTMSESIEGSVESIGSAVEGLIGE